MKGCQFELPEGMKAEGCKVLVNDLSRFGLRRIHVVRAGEAIDRAPWLEMVHEFCADVQYWEYPDEAVGMRHLWMAWHSRGEMLRVKGWRGMLRYVFEGEEVTVAAEELAERFLEVEGRWPGRILGSLTLPTVASPAPAGEGKNWILIEKTDGIPERCLVAV